MSRNPPRPTIGSPGPNGISFPGAQNTAPRSLMSQAVQYFQSGNLRRAERCCREVLEANPSDFEGRHLLGVIAFQKGKPKEAAKLLKQVVDGGSNDPGHLANYARALAATGQPDEAVRIYDRSLALDPGNGGAWNDRGNILFKNSQLSEAERSYRQAIEQTAHDPKAYVNLARLLMAQGRNNEALGVCQSAVSCAPGLAAAHNALGNALLATGDTKGARAAYEKALELDPAFLEPLANMASLYEEVNDLEQARAIAERVLTLDKKNPHALLVLAKCDRRDGDMEKAVARLKKINRATIPASLHRDVAFELSRLYDRLNKTEEAFVAMADGNAQTLIAEGVDETMGDQFLDTADRLKRWMTPDAAKTLLAIPPGNDDYPDPVFLVGFPRSGTTLLGQVLDSHSDLVMVEERPMLDRVVTHVRNDLGGYPDGIGALDGAAVKNLRSRYFEAVDTECDRSRHQRVVDKFPLHLVHVGLIRAIFPKAQFILALRHPCDVVLSCFMQNFRPNPAMANFFSIERGARTYDQVMTLWSLYEKRLQPVAHTIRYENVVTDFDQEIGALLDFLDLEWEDGVRNFADHARSRGKIDTPSYAQVTEDLYTRARYRWRRYEEQMQPAMADLMPWIKHFGYDDD